MSKQYFAKIIKTDDEGMSFVINKGSQHGVQMFHTFLIIEVGDEIFDPETDESLGRLEIVKGEVKPQHIQEKMTTLVSNEHTKTPDRKETKYSRSSISDPFTNLYRIRNREIPIETVITGELKVKPIKNVKIGDCVSIISK